MNLHDFSPLQWALADWCTCQPDLAGFAIRVDPKEATLIVTLEWNAREGDAIKANCWMSPPPKDAGVGDTQDGWLSELEEVAAYYRKRLRAREYYRRRTDPNRLPG